MVKHEGPGVRIPAVKKYLIIFENGERMFFSIKDMKNICPIEEMAPTTALSSWFSCQARFLLIDWSKPIAKIQYMQKMTFQLFEQRLGIK